MTMMCSSKVEVTQSKEQIFVQAQIFTTHTVYARNTFTVNVLCALVLEPFESNKRSRNQYC